MGCCREASALKTCARWWQRSVATSDLQQCNRICDNRLVATAALCSGSFCAGIAS